MHSEIPKVGSASYIHDIGTYHLHCSLQLLEIKIESNLPVSKCCTWRLKYRLLDVRTKVEARATSEVLVTPSSFHLAARYIVLFLLLVLRFVILSSHAHEWPLAVEMVNTHPKLDHPMTCPNGACCKEVLVIHY